MFEFKKLCEQCEQMSSVERGLLLADKSIAVLRGLRGMDVCGIDAVKTLAAFVIGSAASDGIFDEKNYLYMYPSLVKVFGDDFDFDVIKDALKQAKNMKKEIDKYTQELTKIIGAADEDLLADVIILCLLITSVDGKVSLKEKRYIRKLCR